MNIICRLFGHRRPLKGWWGDGLYGKVHGGARDGTGRIHHYVTLECPRCGKSYVAARFHRHQVTATDDA